MLKDSTTNTVRTNALLVGKVTSDGGKWAVPGAGVRVTSTADSAFNYRSSTAHQGNFMAQQEPGNYVVSIHHMDFNLFGPYPIELKPGDRREIHIDLARLPGFETSDTLVSRKRLNRAQIRERLMQGDPRLAGPYRDVFTFDVKKLR